LIQGASGSGKTALIGQCEKIAQKQDWKTVEIDAPALWDSNILRDALPNRNLLKMINWKAQFRYRDIVSAEAGVNKSLLSIQKILQSADRPLLLILDEAQMLGGSNKPVGHHASVASNILRAIHNGKLGRSVVLLAAGLGTTKSALTSLRISRFDKKYNIELGPLSKESECAVIQDWLKKEGRAKGDPTAWIDSIANESHGWPQHILSYVDPAVEYLELNNDSMTEEGLKLILEKGRSFGYMITSACPWYNYGKASTSGKIAGKCSNR